MGVILGVTGVDLISIMGMTRFIFLGDTNRGLIGGTGGFFMGVG